eukprot:c10531_g1_i1.p1 GENE.c10531_g1_i1~~c10531_g1_i1.p1  ORF type:complete len:368 (-),score=121.39 c10531_g1_i1:130-1233(-)
MTRTHTSNKKTQQLPKQNMSCDTSEKNNHHHNNNDDDSNLNNTNKSINNDDINNLNENSNSFVLKRVARKELITESLKSSFGIGGLTANFVFAFNTNIAGLSIASFVILSFVLAINFCISVWHIILARRHERHQHVINGDTSKSLAKTIVPLDQSSISLNDTHHQNTSSMLHRMQLSFSSTVSFVIPKHQVQNFKQRAVIVCSVVVCTLNIQCLPFALGTGRRPELAAQHLKRNAQAGLLSVSLKNIPMFVLQLVAFNSGEQNFIVLISSIVSGITILTVCVNVFFQRALHSTSSTQLRGGAGAGENSTSNIISNHDPNRAGIDNNDSRGTNDLSTARTQRNETKVMVTVVSSRSHQQMKKQFQSRK